MGRSGRKEDLGIYGVVAIWVMYCSYAYMAIIGANNDDSVGAGDADIMNG